MNSNNEWLDPLFLERFLSEEEKSIRDNTKKFCQKRLAPIVVRDNINHFFDKELYKEFGNMGLLGSTVKGYGSSEPIDSNETSEGRQNNRRTEFEITGN